jgi:hypothetical protein
MSLKVNLCNCGKYSTERIILRLACNADRTVAEENAAENTNLQQLFFTTGLINTLPEYIITFDI